MPSFQIGKLRHAEATLRFKVAQLVTASIRIQMSQLLGVFGPFNLFARKILIEHLLCARHYAYTGEEPSRQRKWYVQRPWGGNESEWGVG